MGSQIVGFVVTFLAVFAAAWFLGKYMFKVFGGERTLLSPVLRPVERGCYRVMGVDEQREQSWIGYLVAMLLVTVISLLFTYVILRLQDRLPFQSQLNPAHLPGVPADLALNTATSFTTNTNWQNYAGEQSMSYLSQMLALAFHQFLSAATGIALAIAQGPVASMEAIKDLGTNGGGYFNANAAHPFENPTGFTNALEILLCLCIPFGLAFTFGHYAKNVKQGVAIFAAMAIVLVGAASFAAYEEQAGNPALAHAGATWTSTGQQSGGNMEGKEVRFGAIQSAQYGSATTGTSTGSVDSAHDSWTPLGGMVPMVLIQLGEITPGGVGSGLYGMLVFAILAVFIAGLMVGRTPEYLGKKIESREVKLAALSILALPASILGFTAVSVLASRGQAGPLNPGPHGFSEILYAFSSTTGNNGSAFAGLSGNTLYYNTTLSAAMWIGRFIFVIPLLAIAGSMVKKKAAPASAGTFPTDTPLFTGLLIGVILIVGALTFFPALALGPILEHLQLHAGQLAASH
jgi:potassium-transporting ATPase potassium-binding subunit